MKYIGTRNKDIKVNSSEAVLMGICPDGGLFIPEEMPKMEKSLSELIKMTYQELAFEVMKLFLTDYTEEELKFCIDSAYDEKFDTPVIAPLKKAGGVSFLELFHGRTLAFKDMALSILPYLMKLAAKKNGVKEEIVILTATSGDTGKAALEGFANVSGTKIIVFFPEYGVSPVQKLQMVTQEGENTCVAGILGNFDDAQTAVKKIFTDKELGLQLKEKGFIFSSANSINIGRLIPQVVYYYYAYLQMVKTEEVSLGEEINVVVPTGNFGNILAGYYAKEIGLPVSKFICASNNNKVLYDFFKTGEYDKNREFSITMSPSMDILISSNLERLICMMSSQETTKALMENLNVSGKYELNITTKDIEGEFATEEETSKAIKGLFEENGYVIDPHTAVAFAAYEKYKAKTGDERKTVIISTASPYKFAADVLGSIDKKHKETEQSLLMPLLEKVSKVPVPEVIRDIDKRPIRHKNVCEKEKIKEFVVKYLT